MPKKKIRPKCFGKAFCDVEVCKRCRFLRDCTKLLIKTIREKMKGILADRAKE